MRYFCVSSFRFRFILKNRDCEFREGYYVGIWGLDMRE